MSRPTSPRHLGGIACSQCQGPTYVRESRQGLGRRIRRRRVCQGCGHRFTTEEVEVSTDSRVIRVHAVAGNGASRPTDGAAP